MSLNLFGQHFTISEIASFFVDAQKGFTPLCPNELPVPGGDKIVDELLAMLVFAKFHLASGDEHPQHALYFSDKNHPQFSPAPEGKDMDIRWDEHCVVGSYGAELLDGLPSKTSYDMYVPKGVTIRQHNLSAIYYDLAKTESTGVVEYLKKQKVKLVIGGGLATNYCLQETAIDLANNGFKVVINLAASRGIGSEKEIEASIQKMKKVGILFVENAEELKMAA